MIQIKPFDLNVKNFIPLNGGSQVFRMGANLNLKFQLPAIFVVLGGIFFSENQFSDSEDRKTSYFPLPHQTS